MRITHLCLAGTITDGWTYQENIISKSHKQLGHEVSIITSEWMYDNKDKLYKATQNDYSNDDGIRVIRLRIKGKDNLTRKFKRYFGIEEALDSLEPDILFIHGCQFLDISLIAKYLDKHKNIKVFVDSHADFSNSATNYISKKVLHGIIWKKMAHIIEPYTTMFYGVLPARVDFLRDIYGLPEEKTKLLVMGVDDDLAKIALKEETKKYTREKYGVRENDFLVVTGGKIDHSKWQVTLLLEAFSKLKADNAKLIVFGPISEDMRENVTAFCGDSIQHIDWMNAKDSMCLFATADLVVFPGRHSVYWEQVAGLGVPMVVKAWEGTKHVDVGGNVLFLQNDSVEEISELLRRIMDTPEIQEKMKEIAHSKAKNEFSYIEIAKRAIE